MVPQHPQNLPAWELVFPWDFLRDWLPVLLSAVLFSVIRCPRSLILQTLHLQWQAAHFSDISVPCAIPLFRAG